MQYVAVVSASGKPLMPCHPARARELVRKGKAVRRFRKGFFYIRLTEREDGEVQPVACGVDPGSKFEGFSVKSETHTFINVQADAVTHVKEAVKERQEMRRGRRFRKTPCRKPKNHHKITMPPSTKARWNWKLRVCHMLAMLYPITTFVVEDIKAKAKAGKRRWNVSFSPLEVGKQWFYKELATVAPVLLKQGWDTKQRRDELGLYKTSNKSADVFTAHCVDAWTLASFVVGGTVPENKQLVRLSPLKFSRRSLHRKKPSKGGKRTRYGGTISLGFRRGMQGQHVKFGFCYLGGTTGERVSLHAQETRKRLTQRAKLSDFQPYCVSSWRIWRLKGGEVVASSPA